MGFVDEIGRYGVEYKWLFERGEMFKCMGDDDEETSEFDEVLFAAVPDGFMLLMYGIGVGFALPDSIEIKDWSLEPGWPFLRKPRGLRLNDPSSNMNSQFGSMVQ